MSYGLANVNKRYNIKLKHKFRAKAVKEDGYNFSSKLEFEYKKYLDLLQKAGEILFFLSQIPIRLPGGTKYIVDYLIFYTNGDIKFVDVKGLETDVFKIKKREIEKIYPFQIDIVKKGDF